MTAATRKMCGMVGSPIFILRGLVEIDFIDHAGGGENEGRKISDCHDAIESRADPSRNNGELLTIAGEARFLRLRLRIIFHVGG